MMIEKCDVALGFVEYLPSHTREFLERLRQKLFKVGSVRRSP